MTFSLILVCSLWLACALPDSRTESQAVVSTAPVIDSVTTLQDAAASLLADNVHYDPSYYRIPYPNGDVPAEIGVCTDVVIRAYRKLGFDLQKLVHEESEFQGLS